MVSGEIRSILSQMPTGTRSRVRFFKALPQNKRGPVLLGMSESQQTSTLLHLHNTEIIGILHYLDPDEATDILHNVSHHRRASILEQLGGDIRSKVEFLLKFNPKSAAGMMSLDYIQVEIKATFKDVSKIIQRHEKRTGKFPSVLVVQEGFLVGELPGHYLILRKGGDKISEHIRKVPHVRFDANQKQVIRIFKDHPHDKIVVLDDESSILGIIYSDDILRLMENQEANTLADFAGVSQEEDILDNAFAKVRNRYKWLIINLATSFIAAFIVAMFVETLTEFVLLAAYMPIVAAMGGSAGTQTLAVVVRGMALHEVKPETARRIIFAEMTAGAMNGLIIGAIVAVVAILWNKSPWLGAVLGVAMFFNLLFAAVFGATIPQIMKKLGKDPATSATIFITTCTDICGFFVFLYLASIVL
ncbi:magnesium transporter [Candidatus Woesearchaeota archaeon]|nr:magnesium transporter [Candidatus Woesearchaeota archaeon]